MRNRFVLASIVTLVMASSAHPQLAEARDGYRDHDNRARYSRGCEQCGRVIQIESMGRRSSKVGGGTVLGAIVGGALGNTVGRGDGRKAATIAGAVAGGAIGHNVEKRGRDSDRYYRITVSMDRGGRARVYEQPDSYGLRRGDRVYIDNDGYAVPWR
jgi:outer membrane lipoprotein SlyB